MNPRYQSFHIPMTMINYIGKSWSPEVYEKLIQTCKYFFFYHKIVTIDEFVLYTDFEYEGRDPENLDYYYGHAGYYFMDDKLVYKTLRYWPIFLDLNKKIWVTGAFFTGERFSGTVSPPERPDTTSVFLKYIYRCDITHLLLREQVLTSDELAFMTKSVEWLRLYNNKFTFPDGHRLTYGDLFHLTPKLQSIKCSHDQFISSIATQDGNIPTLKNIKKIRLSFINFRNFINYENWCQFIKEHRHQNRQKKKIPPRFKFDFANEMEADTTPLKEAISRVFPTNKISDHICFYHSDNNQILMIKFYKPKEAR